MATQKINANVNDKKSANLVVVSEVNTLVSDDSENGDSFDTGLNFSCNNLDSTKSSTSNINIASIPVVKFSSYDKSSQSPSQLVEISFKDSNVSTKLIEILEHS